MGGMFSLSDTTMVICSKWLMTKAVNIIFGQCFVWLGRICTLGKAFSFVQDSIQSMQFGWVKYSPHLISRYVYGSHCISWQFESCCHSGPLSRLSTEHLLYYNARKVLS